MINFQIVFCKDGVLRGKYNDNISLIPLTFVQNIHKQDDLSFWPACWDNTVLLEQEITFGMFLKCLEPWANFLGKIINRDLAGYIKESKKPLLIKNQSNLDYIAIFKRNELEVAVETLRSEDDNWLDFGKPRQKRLTGKWELNNFYNISGYKKNIEEHYGIDRIPMNEISNVPLILLNYEYLHVDQKQANKLLPGNKEFIGEKTYGLKKKEIKETGYVLEYLDCNSHHVFLTMLKGIFLYFATTITDREEINKEIQCAIDKFKQDNISIERKKSKQKKYKVEVMPGAFDGILNTFKEDSSYWKDLVEIAKNDSAINVMDTKIKIGIEEEKRLYGYIVLNEKNETEFKLI